MEVPMRVSFLKLVVLLAVITLAFSCVSAPPRAEGASDALAESLDIWEEERQAEAIALLEAAISLEPSSLAWYLLGERYFHSADYPAAETAYAEALALDPSFARALFQLTKIRQYHLGSLSDGEAVEAYGRVFYMRPWLEEYGLSYISMMIWDESYAADIEQAFLLLFTEHPDSIYGRSLQLEWLFNTGRQAETAVLASELLDLASSSADIWVKVDMADFLFNKNFRDRARALGMQLLLAGREDEYIREVLERVFEGKVPDLR